MATREALLEELRKIDAITDAEWMQSLSARKKTELEFHDAHRDTTLDHDPEAAKKLFGNKKYYEFNQASRLYISNWIATNARDKVFLDYACGNGMLAIQAAKSGAWLAMGLDISPVSVDNARKEAEKEGVGRNTFFFQADAERTRLPDNSVDVVVCSGMLHHLDLSYAFPELRRIMKPGGILLGVEALNINPLIRLYRSMTPAMRTEYEKEHILSLSDIGFARRFFDAGQTRYWHILSILSPHLRPMAGMFNIIDGVLTRLPGIQLLSWMFSFELIKRDE